MHFDSDWVCIWNQRRLFLSLYLETLWNYEEICWRMNNYRWPIYVYTFNKRPLNFLVWLLSIDCFCPLKASRSLFKTNLFGLPWQKQLTQIAGYIGPYIRNRICLNYGPISRPLPILSVASRNMNIGLYLHNYKGRYSNNLDTNYRPVTSLITTDPRHCHVHGICGRHR